MVGLIPLVSGDIALTVIYCGIIGVAFGIRYEKHDSIFLIFGFVVLTISELFFVSTGVEIFTRTSLFGLIPLWLPFLWAYAFVAIKRSIIILDNNLES
ncbi:MAG: hypothetical protein UX89_C0006G0021 [Parcubacteria group bacterium GW2011_GWA2_47_16]|nr:MAG: hypothetical protein UX89_C0006G0021 [Parcubacteria group bacterium GW2011_GWA2_47_16]